MKVTLGPANLKEGELRSYDVGKRNVLVCKLDGKYKSLDDWCNHAGCLLSGGRLEGNMVVCPCHEIGFDMDSGKNLTSPGIADDQRAFTATVEDGQIVIDGFEPEP
jgi:3-phenylpropionate/trans-cinnamate dioxygenase ferredoxin component